VYAGTEAPAEAHKERKEEPLTLPSPRMARDAAEGRNLRRGSVDGPAAERAEEPPE